MLIPWDSHCSAQFQRLTRVTLQWKNVRPPIFRPLDYSTSPAGTVNQKQKTPCYVLQDSFVSLSFQKHSEHTFWFLCESQSLQLYCLEYRFKLGGEKDLNQATIHREGMWQQVKLKKWMHHLMDVIFSVCKELQGLRPFDPGPVWI